MLTFLPKSKCVLLFLVYHTDSMVPLVVAISLPFEDLQSKAFNNIHGKPLLPNYIYMANYVGIFMLSLDIRKRMILTSPQSAKATLSCRSKIHHT